MSGGNITSAYGERDPVEYEDPETGQTRTTGPYHSGIDIAASSGTSVHATAGGRVTEVSRGDSVHGTSVEVAYPDGTRSRSSHLSSVSVTEGEWVAQGEEIGEVGSTGASTGPHLHQEHYDSQGNRVDPATIYGDRPDDMTTADNVVEDQETGGLKNR
jgi:murein DD-endopeptidase MepM/ murein hydrolase activator NlpD